MSKITRLIFPVSMRYVFKKEYMLFPISTQETSGKTSKMNPPLAITPLMSGAASKHPSNEWLFNTIRRPGAGAMTLTDTPESA